jgi:hypothetical protein
MKKKIFFSLYEKCNIIISVFFLNIFGELDFKLIVDIRNEI